MKTSTRIMLAAMVLWVPFIVVSERTFGSIDPRDVLPYNIGGLVVIYLLKLVLGALIDEKKAKPESE